MAKLGDFYKITSGGTPSRSHEEYYENGSVSWVKTGDLKSKYLSQTEEKISELGLESSSARIYPQNTVLLAMYGATIGAASILKIEAATNQACAAFVPREDILPEYLYAFLESRKERFTKDAVGGAQPNLSASYLKNVKFNHPTLEIQRGITNILNKTDDLIFLRKQQLAKLDELIKARFVEMFGEPLLNTKNWKREPLMEVAPIQPLCGKRSDEVWLLNLDAVEAQTGKVLFKQRVSSKKINTSTVCFTTENVLYSKLRPYLNKVVIPDEDGIATSEMIPLYPVQNKLNRTYLCYWLRSDTFVKHISEKVAGAKMPRVSMDYVRSIMIELPPLPLQNDFAAFVERVDQQKQTVQQSLDKLELMKKALMQEYFG